MPHRTVFQWGKNHVHPFTMFIGGFVVGTLVTGAVAWSWMIAEDSDVDIENVVSGRKSVKASPSPSPGVTASPTASPRVTF